MRTPRSPVSETWIFTGAPGHLERIGVLAASRSLVLRRLTPVLTPEELADFAASLERHSAIVIKPVP
jgi:hypothetical protein